MKLRQIEDKYQVSFEVYWRPRPFLVHFAVFLNETDIHSLFQVTHYPDFVRGAAAAMIPRFSKQLCAELMPSINRVEFVWQDMNAIFPIDYAPFSIDTCILHAPRSNVNPNMEQLMPTAPGHGIIPVTSEWSTTNECLYVHSLVFENVCPEFCDVQRRSQWADEQIPKLVLPSSFLNQKPLSTNSMRMFIRHLYLTACEDDAHPATLIDWIVLAMLGDYYLLSDTLGKNARRMVVQKLTEDGTFEYHSFEDFQEVVRGLAAIDLLVSHACFILPAFRLYKCSIGPSPFNVDEIIQQFISNVDHLVLRDGSTE